MLFPLHLCFYGYLCILLRSCVDLDQWYQSNLLFLDPSLHVPNKLGLDLVEPLQDQPHKPRQRPMGDEKKDEGTEYPIKILLEEALEKQRNTMMDNFAQILQRLPTSDASASSSHSGGATPFKVQVNFDIPIFDG